MKVKVMRSNPGYLLKSFLIYLDIKLNDFYTQGDEPIGPEDYEDEDDSKPEQLYGAPPGGDDQSEYSPPG